MSKTPDPCWSIQAKAFKIHYTPFSHLFWVLVKEKEIVDQLHGLAFQPEKGTTVAIGNASCQLLAVNDATISWSLQPNQKTAVGAQGTEQEINTRWQAALVALPEINSLNLTYPNLWQHFCKKNSNSLFHTLGLIMAIPNPASLLPIWAPGIQFLLDKTLIEKYRYSTPSYK